MLTRIFLSISFCFMFVVVVFCLQIDPWNHYFDWFNYPIFRNNFWIDYSLQFLKQFDKLFNNFLYLEKFLVNILLNSSLSLNLFCLIFYIICFKLLLWIYILIYQPFFYKFFGGKVLYSQCFRFLERKFCHQIVV